MKLKYINLISYQINQQHKKITSLHAGNNSIFSISTGHILLPRSTIQINYYCTNVKIVSAPYKMFEFEF